jgi:SEC-C motif-containing protein
MAKQKNKLCPCGSGQAYSDCCGRFIEGNELPTTPEQLMRSRYTAYCLNNDTYIIGSWHPSTRPGSLAEDNAASVKWIELKVLNAPVPAESESRATVEFMARCKVGGKAEKMHETSEFIREDGRWYYLSGQVG